MVLRAIEAPRSVTPNRSQEPQENIQDKIQKLKRRFQDLQPEETQPPPSANRTAPASEETQDNRAAEIKRRIEEMKNKMGSTMGRK